MRAFKSDLIYTSPLRDYITDNSHSLPPLAKDREGLAHTLNKLFATLLSPTLMHFLLAM